MYYKVQQRTQKTLLGYTFIFNRISIFHCGSTQNQRKIWKTEPKENLHQPLCTFKCRKVIMPECPQINVLNVETSSYSNIET